MTERTDIQEAALAKLDRLRVGALFMEMGTGKTRVALDLMAAKASRCGLLLWLCPCALKGEIEAERLKWHPELELRVVGVETISSSERTYLSLLEEVKTKRTFCVVDESLKIKNLAANRTKRILAIGSYCAFRLILNGTPLSRSVMDLWSQMEFLSPKILGMSMRQFRDTYCEWEKKSGRGIKILGSRNVPHLVAKMEPYIFDARLYLDIRRDYRAKSYFVDTDAYAEFKDEVFRSDAVYNDDGELTDISFYKIISRLQRWYTSRREHYEAIGKAVEEADGSCIVFVKFVSSIPEGALSLTGDVPQEERQDIIRRHREGESKALYVTYGLGAYGLNLQYCHTAIFAEHSWDYAQRIQAEARIYRLGQTETCTFVDIDANTGLEDMLHSCNNRKERLADRVKSEITRQKKSLKEAL